MGTPQQTQNSRTKGAKEKSHPEQKTWPLSCQVQRLAWTDGQTDDRSQAWVLSSYAAWHCLPPFDGTHTSVLGWSGCLQLSLAGFSHLQLPESDATHGFNPTSLRPAVSETTGGIQILPPKSSTEIWVEASIPISHHAADKKACYQLNH